MAIPSLFSPEMLDSFRARHGLIRVPQHPKAAEPCCLKCGDRDGRTAAGALFCHDCHEENPRCSASS